MLHISSEQLTNLSIIKIGDLITFTCLEEHKRVGLVLDIFRRDNDQCGSEIYVLSDGERWSVPQSWCMSITC